MKWETRQGKKQKSSVFKDDEYLNFFFDAAGYREFCQGLARLLPDYETSEKPTSDQTDNQDN